ncbi:zf-HC2 domain-containing protein [Streptomyces sp. SP17BM10]|uniref:zf-HC2 domain-containing protein n=1 Tax=Streptomyces sp. SP17BM10 TaxID=3002530 RepID=UPI002E769E32|nr:zf-HC2 domain-containing protein [Streptomyces sp. SP17BM10]MEE1784898.1 zf-HC2 domain-containing protein [Streptomyces sp. SP17BM10]
MSGTGRSGSGRPESSGRSAARRGWALPGRRGGDEPGEPLPSAAPLPGDAELRAVAVRPAEPAAEEHHLGERLSAFLDGELGHDSRERVQAHLATCPQCLAEADEGRGVKHLLTRTGTPGPSAALMARLMAVGSLPDDEQPGSDWHGGRDDDDLPGGGVTGPGTLGGSRLNGGSFGRGAGASFGAGALGADTPLPGVDPRAFGRGGAVLRPLMGRRAPRPEASGRPQPAAAVAVARPSAPRGRRFVFAAAGAFSVAAVTLGGVGGLTAQSEDQHGTSVSPVGPAGTPGRSGGLVPMNAQVPVDFPGFPVAATREATRLPDRPVGGLTALHREMR